LRACIYLAAFELGEPRSCIGVDTGATGEDLMGEIDFASRPWK
jgi:hypothetical protein